MKRKVKLTIEELEVNTFATSGPEVSMGTVNAHEKHAYAVTQWPGCVPGCNTRLTCSTNLC